MSKKVIGIDLGSTLTEVAVIENGKPVVVVNEEGGTTTPSVVSFKDNERKVGNSAKRQMVVNPKQTVNLIKRFMGATFDESKEAIEHVQYDVVNRNNKPYVSIDGREYSAEEISSIILTKMKKIAEDYLGTEVKDAVITVPAFFSDTAKAATKTAGELAGLNVLRIIAEPTSAILSSNIDKVKGGKYIVVDYGGSTLDFSVADIEDNVVEILASSGDVYCGGSDIDKLVADYLVSEFKKENGINLSDDAMAMTRVYEAAEKAKIELSNSSVAEINLPYITVKDNAPVHMITKLTKAKFEQLIDSTLNHVIDCGKDAMKKAGLNINELDGVLLVGGSCRIPALQDKLVKTFGDKLIKSSNLDLAVAEGAAIQANILAGNTDSDILLLDVTPLRLGIETEGGVMTTIVESNTTIPCKKTEVFTTAVDNQPSVTISVLQGERPLAKDNKTVGRFNLDGILPAKRGVPQIEVTFDIDANGILSVTAKDKASGKEQHITIENSNSLSPEEIERIKKDAEAHAEADAKTKKELETANRVEATIYQTENLLESFKDNAALTEDDKTYFNTKLDELKKIKEDKNYNGVDTILEEVNKRWNAVSVKAYGGSNNAQGGNGNAFGDFGNMFNQNGGNPFNFNSNFKQPTDTTTDEEVDKQGE